MKKHYNSPKIALEELVKTDVLCESRPDNSNYLHGSGNASHAPGSYERMSGMADDIFAV